jgi:hypothetical protein
MHLHYQVWEIGTGRDEELASSTFSRRFGRAANPYSELVRLARMMGARVHASGRVIFDVPAITLMSL